ncbi:MAG: DUF4276 family protein [bacterium]|nr:DUF4276 family protein [bacterium]
MKTIAFFLEELSAEKMLEGILPKIVPEEISIKYIKFNGKQDLEKNLLKKLKHWNLPDTHFVILRDQDRGDCLQVKSNLQDICRQAGKENVLVRIACRELESFYLGDLEAVERALDLPGLSSQQEKKKYRAPDNLQNPCTELEALTNFQYQKVSGSREISPLLNLSNNRSESFKQLVLGLQRMISNLP